MTGKTDPYKLATEAKPVEFTDFDRELLIEINRKLSNFEDFAEKVKPMIEDIGPMLEKSPILRMLGIGR